MFNFGAVGSTIFLLLKYATGFYELAKTIVGILTAWAPDVAEFIKNMIIAKDQVIDAIDDFDAKEQAKEDAHNDVVTATLANFTNSPSLVEEWFIHTFIKTFIRARKDEGDVTDRAYSAGLIKDWNEVESVDEVVKHMRSIGIG